ncbi:VOC family protein [Tropicimonas sp. IMCC34043]|uniref:VOC family protein n=1 Tax=Tropicimonas sp. IMCC34043 TaxID=2248760 RepID=UPI000E27AE8E|nr:VOC family protein [Tropicimonas sp. IMCC34043]
MEQRVSLITLGVEDPARAEEFYSALGWQRAVSEDGVVVFNLIGQALALYSRTLLARDIGLTDSPGGFTGLTLSYNVRERDEVDELLARVQAAGGRVLRPAADIFWGGHVGYFADPDGHVWEVAWNPFSPLGPDGAFQWEDV